VTYRNAAGYRKEPTDPERLMWGILRDRRFAGYKFRRQHPVGRYVSDFACIRHRLIVELDGGQHVEQTRYDEARDAYLRKQGFVVLRFWNLDLLKNREGVLETILAALAANPSPGRAGARPPSPQRGEG